MASPASNADFNAHNSSVRNADKKGGSVSSYIPTQDQVGAAFIPSAPENQAFTAEERTHQYEAMGMTGTPSPPDYQSSMADCHTRTSQPLGVTSSNSPLNIQLLRAGDQQQSSRTLGMASTQFSANNQSFTQLSQPQSSQPRSKGIIIISILHFLGGLLTCVLGVTLCLLRDGRFSLFDGFVGNTLLLVAAGITGLCNGAKKSSLRFLVINMVMNMICVPFTAISGIRDASWQYSHFIRPLDDFYYYDHIDYQLKVPFLVVTTLLIIVYISELFFAVVGSSFLYVRIHNVPQRAFMTQMVVNSGNRNGSGQMETDTFYMPYGQATSNTGEYVPLQLIN